MNLLIFLLTNFFSLKNVRIFHKQQSKTKDKEVYVDLEKAMQEIQTFERLEQANVWTFSLRNTTCN